MRNFYITADIDGRQTQLAGGTAPKDGGMRVRVLQRDKGRSVRAFAVESWAEGETLVSVVFDNTGVAVARFETQR